MPSYLISWKPATENEERGWPVEEFVSLSEKLRTTGTATEPWRFSRREGVAVGERVFLLRQGRAGHAILGYGRIAAIPSRKDGYTAVTFERLLNPTSGLVLATQDELRAITTKFGVWNTMVSGILLSADVASRLEELVVDRQPVEDRQETAEPGGKWTRDELMAAVQAYLDMQSALRDGKQLNKKAIYRSLVERFGRTAKSYEYRMQNISYVLSLQGRSWIPGLVPARNVGANVAAEIESLLAEVEGRQVNASVAQEVAVHHAVGKGSVPKPAGSRAPKAVTTQTTQIERDPEVKAWVLIAAKGRCECCKKKAPFISTTGLPFLEVHHIRTLADGGSDTIENAVALCPNCHRRLHYGQDSHHLVGKLYLSLGRLVRE